LQLPNHQDAIRLKFLPALTGQNAFNDLERDVIALPVHLGGLGIANPCKHSSSQHSMSSWLSALPIAEHGFALHKGAFVTHCV